MGITRIALVDGTGDEEAIAIGDTRLLERLLPQYDDPTSQCLRFVDVYGDTVFNRLQMAQLLVEWDQLSARANEADTPVVEEVRGLIRRCQAEPQTYVKFYGD